MMSAAAQRLPLSKACPGVSLSRQHTGFVDGGHTMHVQCPGLGVACPEDDHKGSHRSVRLHANSQILEVYCTCKSDV
jgi:hypothetical protein